MKIVLDTNIFISGMFWEGDSYKILDLWRKHNFELITSIEIIEELNRTFNNFKIKLEKQQMDNLNDMILKNSILVIPTEKINIVKDDPDDNKFIEAAIKGNAQYIITQDNHLLKIKYYGEIKIITPREFLILF